MKTPRVSTGSADSFNQGACTGVRLWFDSENKTQAQPDHVTLDTLAWTALVGKWLMCNGREESSEVAGAIFVLEKKKLAARRLCFERPSCAMADLPMPAMPLSQLGANICQDHRQLTKPQWFELSVLLRYQGGTLEGVSFCRAKRSANCGRLLQDL